MQEKQTRPQGEADPALRRRLVDVSASGDGRVMLTPFARALSILAAFTPSDTWLGNGELAARTELPPSTVTRIAQTLVALGYLHNDVAERKYRLAALVLAIGYTAIADSDIQRIARPYMQAFADEYRVHVSLSTRDRLDLIVLEARGGQHQPVPPTLRPGARVAIASSAMGWALLAALPHPERQYLLESVERLRPREWARMRRRCSAALAEVSELGHCSAVGEWAPELAVVATPLAIESRASMVLACVGLSSQFTRARITRELGPRLLALSEKVRRAANPG